MRSATLVTLTLLAVAGAARAEIHASAVLPPAAKSITAGVVDPSDGVPSHRIALGRASPQRSGALREAEAGEAKAARAVGVVRELPPLAGSTGWRAVPGGIAARFSIHVDGAKALRVRIDSRKPVRGLRAEFSSPARPGAIQAESLEAPGATWGPLVEGEETIVELFAPVPIAAGDIDVALTHAADHFDTLSAKAASAKWFAQPCQADLVCEAKNDPLLARAGSASLKISWVEGNTAYACSATLLNPADGSFRPYIYTAAHCIADEAAARNVVAQWFYETTTCGGDDVRAEAVTIGGGAQLLASDRALDASFLRLNRMPPAGVTYAGWNSDPPRQAEAITALHHANGEVTKVSHGEVMAPPPYDFVSIAWTSGIVQGGSSGSGLFTRIDAPFPDVLFRGSLASGNSSCSSPGFALYSRIDKFWPKIAPYLSTSAKSANATGLWFDADEPGWGVSLSQQGDTVFGVLYIHGEDGRPTWLVAPAMRGSDAGAFSGSAYRTTGSALDATPRPMGVQAAGSLDIRLSSADRAELALAVDGKTTTRRLSRQVYGANAPVCAASPQQSRASAANYQDLWWDPDEPGWGLALAHQDDVLFATLFTYDEGGAATWYVGSNVQRQAQGRFKGTLYRTARKNGAKDAWPATEAAAAGEVEIAFSDGETGVAVFTLHGMKQTRRIVRQVFGSVTTLCR